MISFAIRYILFCGDVGRISEIFLIFPTLKRSFIAIVVLFLLTASEISSAVLAFSEPERISGKVVSYKVTRLDLQEKTVRKYTLYILTITDIDKRPVFMKKGEKFLKVISSKPVPSKNRGG